MDDNNFIVFGHRRIVSGLVYKSLTDSSKTDIFSEIKNWAPTY
jgi:hypothetical protein